MMLGILVLLLIAILAIGDKVSTCSDKGICTNFDSLDLPQHRDFQTGESSKSTLTLSATGKRRKSLFIIEVDVYKVGVYLSNEKALQLASSGTDWSNHIGRSLENQAGASVGVVLQFIVSVGTEKVVDAIVEALTNEQETDEYKAAVAHMKDLLTSNIGKEGIKKTDEIEFVFYGTTSDDISVSVKGNWIGGIKQQNLRARLIEIYCGPNSVAPTVFRLLDHRFTLANM
jgi:hypothetical protein